MIASALHCAILGEKFVPRPVARRTSEKPMSEPRVIKKYPNRRLYDTVESRYITLADIRRIVLAKVDFMVIDKKTGGDITRSILLQVVAEQEALQVAVLSQNLLADLIRTTGSPNAALLGPYLERCLKLFGEQSGSTQDELATMLAAAKIRSGE
jgi:polyhydroxyalkanoate synthesis repressor PhaR